MEFRAASVDWMDRVDIIAAEIDHSHGKLGWIAKPIEFVMVKREPDTFIQRATMELDAQAARSLMNALWNAGVRPTDFKHPSGELNRMEAHLKDMQRLVFKDKK